MRLIDIRAYQDAICCRLKGERIVDTNLMDCLFRQGFSMIAFGCYSTVYASSDSEWIVKKGKNDGTRTYLEWVLWRTKCNRRLPGMPEVDFVVSHGETDYIAAMRRYTRLNCGLFDGFAMFRALLPAHAPTLRILIDEFEDETGIQANDLHTGNFMLDDCDNVVLTDPSFDGYQPLGSTAPMPLIFI